MLSIISLGMGVVYAEHAPVVDNSQHYTLAQNESKQSTNQAPKSSSTGPTAVREEESPNEVLLDKISSLQQELQTLRGQVEVLNYDFKRLRKEQQAFYQDLDTRLSEQKKQQLALTESISPNVETTKSSQVITDSLDNSENAKQASTSEIPVVDEQLSYAQAYEQLEAKRYSEALASMQSYLSHFPNGTYAANANYWSGELWLKEGNLIKAKQAFSTVVVKFPESNKVSASLYKLGLTNVQAGDFQSAKKNFEQVQKQFPDSSTARLAQNQLDKIQSIS